MKVNSEIAPALGIGRLGLHAFAVLTAVVTFILLTSGGLVTSKGVGMAVPDWPTTFGYNMFLFPISGWVGGVFYEHSHRLIASGVGLLTLILCGWIFACDPRHWVRVVGVLAVVAVCIQGILGGLRVTLIKNEIGIFHGMLAQAFFVTVAILAVATSPGFLRACARGDRWNAHGLQWLVVAFTALVFVQLGVAASMRHAHLGLSIPDFPLAYGQVIPKTDPATMNAINTERVARNEMPTTAVQVWLQMKHRLIAIGIFALAIAMVVKAMRSSGVPSGLRGRIWLIFSMVCAQIGLGAWTIWSNKAADVATAHMALGALILMLGGITAFRLLCLDRAAKVYAMEFPNPTRRETLVSAQ